MEILLALAFFGGLVALGLFLQRGKHRPAPSPLPPLEALGAHELEKQWIDVKARLMGTDPYEDELPYAHLFDQATRLRDQLLNPYRRLLDPANVADTILKYSRQPQAQLLYIDPKFNAALLGDDVALGLSFYCYTGCTLTSKQRVATDHHTYTRLLDELIARQSAAAYLLKGLILKYGMTLSAPPDLASAEAFLMEAKRRGIEAAGGETSLLRAHSRLESIPSVGVTNEPPKWE